MTATADIPPFDPTSTAFYGDVHYFDTLRLLRDQAPVHRVAPDTVTIARYDDIREVSRDPGRFSSAGGALVNDPLRVGGSNGGPQSILFMDPPQHTQHRRILRRQFTPRAVGLLEARVRTLVTSAFEGVPTREPIDVVDELTAPFPLLVICELLGIADSERGDFRRWSDATIASNDRTPEETMEAVGELQVFLSEHIAAKRRQPGDDLVSELASARVEDRPLDAGEMFSWLLTLLVAGNETTRSLLSGGIHTLACHPDERARLAADPSTLPGAVEELLRWVTPIQTFCRTVTVDTEVGSHDVRRGDYLIMLYASGNRDERAFGPTADRFNPARPIDAAHLAFGFGEHLCLGAALARLEARVFFEELLRRHPTYAVLEAPERVPSTLVAGITSMSLILDP